MPYLVASCNQENVVGLGTRLGVPLGWEFADSVAVGPACPNRELSEAQLDWHAACQLSLAGSTATPFVEEFVTLVGRAVSIACTDR